MNERLQNLISDLKKHWYVPAIIVLGMVLMLFQGDAQKSTTVVSGITNSTFVSDTEARVTEMLKEVEGAGECVVTITLASGGKKEYVREDGNVLVITDKDGNQSAVVSKENAPEIAGVTIACTGAGSVEVRNRIIQSVSTVLGIGANKICVIMRG
ncbi:MAG: hypothetical protein IJD09_01040 [Clostridia bacterium]|nr:hypothetical protein [Clostridia bacterium]